MRIKRSLLFGFVAILLVASVFGTVTGVSVEDESLSGGSVAEEDAVEIEDWHDLDAVRDGLDGDYILMNDLDEDTDGYDELVDTEEGWEPIGDLVDGFNGTFEGNGHEIRGLYIRRPEKQYVGLFGRVKNGAEVNDIGVIDVEVTGGWYVGGLLGANIGQVSNSYMVGEVSGDRNVGGLVGWNGNIVSNSHSDGSVSGDEEIGELVGRNTGTVENSYSTGDVSGDRNIGGLVGENWEGTVKNSYAVGDVNGENWQIGGLVGKNNYATIENSYAEVGVSGESRVGGLVGENVGFGTVKNSYAEGEVYGESSVGGLVGSNSGTVENSYAEVGVSGGNGVGGLVGRNPHGTVTNSHYNIDEVLINGGNHITIGGIFEYQYQDWRKNELYLDISDYSDTLVLANDYYEISCVDGLQDLLGFAVNEEYRFRLTEDIDLSSDPGLFIPYLAADFDGNGYTISNSHIDVSFANEVGMFGFVDGGTVLDFSMNDAEVNGYGGVGILVGRNYGTVKNSYTTGNVNGGWYVGALVGRNHGAVKNSYTTGEANGDNRVGSLIGENWRGTVENSYSLGDVTGDDFVGGLIGRIWGGTVEDSYAAGTVRGYENLGGLIGESEDAEIKRSFWDKETSGINESDGGTGKTTAEMVKEETFTDADWDFEETWDIIDGETYPFLQWQEEDTYPNAQFFEVEIIDYDEEVEEGEEVVVEYEIENTGEAEDTQDIEFYVGDELIETEEDVSLEAGEVYEGEFVWETEEGDAGDHELEVASEDDSEMFTVTVEEEDEEVEDDDGIPGFTSTLLLLGVIFAVAIYGKKKQL